MGNAKQKYEDDSVFGSGIFDSIVGDLTPTNVTNAQQNATNVVEVGIYNTNGVRLQHKVRGLNIIKMSTLIENLLSPYSTSHIRII